MFLYGLYGLKNKGAQTKRIGKMFSSQKKHALKLSSTENLIYN